MAMFYDKETDQILVGTNGNGVYCIDIAKKTVKKIQFPFPHNSWMCSLLLDSQQTLWIATSSGLFYYSEKNLVSTVNADQTIDKVCEDVQKALED